MSRIPTSGLPQKRSSPTAQHTVPSPIHDLLPKRNLISERSHLRAYPFHPALSATLPAPFPWPLAVFPGNCVFLYWIILRVMLVDQIQQILYRRVILRLCFLQYSSSISFSFSIMLPSFPNRDSHPQLRHTSVHSNLFFAGFRMSHLLLHFIRHINQSKPIEHPINVSHSPDIAQSFRAVYHFSHLFNIL